MFRRNPRNGTTDFIFNLTRTEVETFKHYYNQFFAGLILGAERKAHGKIKITMDTQKLFDAVIPRLAEYKQKSLSEETSSCSMM